MVSKKITDCVKALLLNTTNVYLKEELEYVIRNVNLIEDEDIYAVIKTISETDYDIKNYMLYEIPHPCVYCFVNVKNKRCFDVVNYQDTWAFSYVKDSTNYPAHSIQEAIQKYEYMK